MVWVISEEADGRIRLLLDERTRARTGRNFARADAIREGLTAAGVKVMDRPNAPSDWELSPEFDPAKLETLR